MPAACRAASAAHMRRGVERQPRLSSHPCHARRRAPCAPVGALAVLHQPARRGAMHPGHCVGRQPACLSTEQERMLRTLAQHQLASNQALSPLHSRPRAPAAALLNAQAQEPPLVVAALCSAACEQRSARQTRGTPGRLWDGGPPSECEPHRRPCLPQPRASGAKRQRRACFSVTDSKDILLPRCPPFTRDQRNSRTRGVSSFSWQTIMPLSAQQKRERRTAKRAAEAQDAARGQRNRPAPSRC